MKDAAEYLHMSIEQCSDQTTAALPVPVILTFINECFVQHISNITLLVEERPNLAVDNHAYKLSGYLHIFTSNFQYFSIISITRPMDYSLHHISTHVPCVALLLWLACLMSHNNFCLDPRTFQQKHIVWNVNGTWLRFH